MRQTILLQKLKSSVSPEEYTELLNDTYPKISKHNRCTILQMMQQSETAAADISDEKILSLRNILEDYLRIYLPGEETRWKWIIISCIYLSFICEKPLHAQESTHYTIIQKNGETQYYCPLKSQDANTACSFCVCQRPPAENF